MKLSMNVMLFLIFGLPSLLLGSQADIAAQGLTETKNNQVLLEQSAKKLEGTLQKAQQLTEDAQELARLKTAESERAKEAEKNAKEEADTLRAKNQQLMGLNMPNGKKSNHSFSLLDVALATSLLSALTTLAVLFLKKKPQAIDVSKLVNLTVTAGDIKVQVMAQTLKEGVLIANAISAYAYLKYLQTK